MDETERSKPTGAGALKTLIFYYFAVEIIMQMQTTSVEETRKWFLSERISERNIHYSLTRGSKNGLNYRLLV